MDTRRYMVASALKPESLLVLKQLSLKVKQPHLTWLPPFMVKDERFFQVVESLNIPLEFDRGFQLVKWGTFHQLNRKILYVELASKTNLEQLVNEFELKVSSLIDFDLSIYDGDVKPRFIPHISLDYDYQAEEGPTDPLLKDRIFLEKPKLFQEVAMGEWV